MSKKLEDQLKAWGKQKQEESVPVSFSKGIDAALDNLPVLQQNHLVLAKKRNNNKIAKVIVSAAAAVTIGVFSSGFVSPAMANVLKEIPLIGSIFDSSSDPSLQIVGEKGLATAFNETVTDNGVSVTITEAYYGGGLLAIGYKIDTDKTKLKTIEKSQGVPVHFEATLDGEQFSFVADYEQVAKNGVANGIIDIKVGLKTMISEEPTLQLNINEVSGIEGNWNFNLPVTNKESKAATTTFTPMVSTQWDDATFIVEKAEFTPASSQVIIDRTVPKGDVMNYQFKVFDENGNLIDIEGQSGSTIIDKGNGMVNFKDSLILEGRENAPQGLIIEVYNNHGATHDSENLEEVKIDLNETEFPHTIKMPNRGELVITGYEQLNDKTVVNYDIKGALALQNWFLMLEDQNGENHTPESNGIRTNPDQLSFQREFAKTEGPIS